MADHNELGKEAENLAAEYLLKNEYKILMRNFYIKHLRGTGTVDVTAVLEYI